MILQFCDRFIQEHGYGPTLREISAGVGQLSISTIGYHLRQLAKEGKILYSPRKSRTIAMVPAEEAGCPVCNAVWTEEDWEAGSPHEYRIEGHMMYHYSAEAGWEGTEINFCPACGRNLVKQDNEEEGEDA